MFISTLNIKRELYDKYKFLDDLRLVAVGQRATDFIALLRLIQFEALIICENEPRAPNYWSDTIVVSQEENDYYRRTWSNDSLGTLYKTSQNILKKIEETEGGLINVLTYAASKEWEKLNVLKNNKFHVIGSPYHIKDIIDNKITTREALRKRGIPVPLSIEMVNSDMDFRLLKNIVGNPFILQMSSGSSGKGTYIINNEQDLEQAKGLGYEKTWLVSRYIGRTTLNVHGLAFPNCICTSIPSVQITGIPGMSVGWASYCGNDFWSAKVHYESLGALISRLVADVGQWLLNIGYEGIYGVDIALDGNKAYVIEVNPRLQGSTWLLSEIEFEMGLVPLSIQHFFWHLGKRFEFANNSMIEYTGASYLIIHSTIKTNVFFKHRLCQGAYIIDNSNNLKWQHDCIGIHELKNDEFLLFGLPHPEGIILEHGSVVVRIASRKQLASIDGRTLNPLGRKIVLTVKRELNIF